MIKIVRRLFSHLKRQKQKASEYSGFPGPMIKQNQQKAIMHA